MLILLIIVIIKKIKKKSLVFLGTESEELTNWNLNINFDTKGVDVTSGEDDPPVYLYKIADITGITDTGEPIYNNAVASFTDLNIYQVHFPVDDSEIANKFITWCTQYGISPGREFKVDFENLSCFEDLTPGVYVLSETGGPYGGEEFDDVRGDCASGPVIFSNLKYDENGKVTGSYSELNLTVYMNIIFDYEIGKIREDSEPENGRYYQVGKEIGFCVNVWSSGTWLAGYRDTRACRLMLKVKSGSTGNEWTDLGDHPYWCADVWNSSIPVSFSYVVQPEDVGYPIEIEATRLDCSSTGTAKGKVTKN